EHHVLRFGDYGFAGSRPVAVNLKLLKRHSGMRAPQLAIRPGMPRYLRRLGLSCSAIAVAGLLWLAYHYGQSYAGFERGPAAVADDVGAQSAQLESANAALKSELAVVLRELQIERAAQQDLARQLKVLTLENAQLKEDIAVLQTIFAPAGKSDGISV